MLQNLERNPLLMLKKLTRPFIVPRTATSLGSSQLVYGMVVVVVVAAIAVALTLQGWRSRTPAFDLLTYIHSVRNLLATGTIPQHGDTGSYGSFKPPGTAWFMIPSTLLFADPRLSEYLGTAFLHFATLLGLFLLARAPFGTWCACLSVLLYGLSHHGIFLAGSLWPNGRPDFYVWTVYFAIRWVTCKDAKYLAAAVTIWAVGMHVDMAIAPAFFILPAMWLFYHPPLRLRPLLVGGAIALIVWYPYLHFEAARGFADLRSQLLLQNIFPANYTDTWCDSTLILQNWEDTTSKLVLDSTILQTPENKTLDPLSYLLSRGSLASDKLLSNFKSVAPVPGASIALLLLALSSIVVLSMSGSSIRTVKSIVRHRFWRYWLTPFAISMILSAVLANEFVVARYFSPDGILEISTISSIRRLQVILVLSGILILMRRWIAAIVNQPMILVGVNIGTLERTEKARLLVLSLVIPWFILLLLAEPGKPERFWWLWPLQVMFLAVFVTNILPRLGTPRKVVWVVQILLIFIVVGNPFLLSRVDAWLRTGWAGPDAEQVQVVDYVATQLRSEGKDRAAIGYQTFIYQFMVAYNIINPQYKVGAEFDLLFKYLHGISNTDRCAEGVAPSDEYRIVQIRPESNPAAPRKYFDVPLDGRFHMLRDFGSYQVFKRD